jgi:ribonuclease HIII
MKTEEIERLTILKEYETKIYEAGIKLISGCDEAGRGPLAGPVVVRCSHYAKRFFYRRCKRFQKNL